MLFCLCIACEGRVYISGYVTSYYCLVFPTLLPNISYYCVVLPTIVHYYELLCIVTSNYLLLYSIVHY